MITLARRSYRFFSIGPSFSRLKRGPVAVDTEGPAFDLSAVR